MKRFIPSTSALLAFEAAVQHLNFTRAGTALGMTQSGISRQINSLETQLGTPLFERIGPRLKLTDAGRTYVDEITPLLNQIEAASIAIVRGAKEQTAMTIAVQDSFANSWLASRIPGLCAEKPARSVLPYHPECAILNRSKMQIRIFPFCGAKELGEKPIPICFSRKSWQLWSLPLSCPMDSKIDVATDTSIPKLQASHRQDNWLRWYSSKGIKHQGNLQGPRFGPNHLHD